MRAISIIVLLAGIGAAGFFLAKSQGWIGGAAVEAGAGDEKPAEAKE